MTDATPRLDLPVAQYLADAVDAHHENEQPEWQLIFDFVRNCKAHPKLGALTAKQVFKEIESVMRTWKRDRAQQPDDWEHWFGIDRETAQTEFVGGWDKVRYLPGYDPLGAAIERARRQPLTLPPELLERYSDKYPTFISIAFWLQVGMGDSPIELPLEKLGERLGVKPKAISRYRQWGIEDGFLKEVKPYAFYGKGKEGNRATEFRFNVARVPSLKHIAEDGTAESFAAV